MADRYFVEPPIDGDRAELSGPEAHHLMHVMRARPGAEVLLFDGSGVEFTARVDQVGRDRVQLAVLSREPVDREMPLPVALGVALPKGDRQRWLVEKAVELGIARIIPLETQRGVAQPVASTLSRLRRTVVEASKQCGRARLMDIAEPLSWEEYMRAASRASCRLLAHPGGTPAATAALGVQPAAAIFPEIQLAIGPEGGFTDEELAVAVDSGWQVVDLGPRILRVETAAVLLTALVTLRTTP